MFKKSMVLIPLFLFFLGATAGAAGAAQPQPWQMGFQPAASPVMREINDFHNLLLVISVLICAVVLGLLVYVMARFNEKANPTPSKTTHNTFVEVLWTALPVLILVIIAVPSFKLLYFMDRTHNPEMTIKATGHQWYWSYDYPDHGNFTFDALMVPDDELKEGQPRLLETDKRVVLPVDTDIRILLTSDDVIHNWAVPALGVKYDTVPGRINETWVRIEREGTFYGQCSELCGINHAYMPITVEAVSKAAFAEWVEKAKREFAGNGPNPVRVAGARAAGR
ncbi:MAG: cytochrome c oxidase subunit II [Rhodospirillales bacterium]|nr:cytochrome c oxidase subunit II [Rhodospirillales bacterium]MDP6882901.1 cytochrome c oxidase subunit II [Rhodospirillales bacterium]